MSEQHYSVDSYPIKVGSKFWNNDLRVCQVTQVARHSNEYADTGETQTWHSTSHGEFDTLTGTLQRFGRLTRVFEGRDAESYEPGTEFRDIDTY